MLFPAYFFHAWIGLDSTLISLQKHIMKNENNLSRMYSIFLCNNRTIKFYFSFFFASIFLSYRGKNTEKIWRQSWHNILMMLCDIHIGEFTKICLLNRSESEMKSTSRQFVTTGCLAIRLTKLALTLYTRTRTRPHTHSLHSHPQLNILCNGRG